MASAPSIDAFHARGKAARSALSCLTLATGCILLAATFVLLSPPTSEGYPGAIPWRSGSLLRPLLGVLSLGGGVHTARGVEIKDFAFRLAAGAGLLLLAVRALVSGLLPPQGRTTKGAWFFGQAGLALWALISLWSAAWSQDAPTSLGQGAIYAISLAWAVGLCWNLESRDIPRMIWSYLALAATAAALCIWHYYERNPYHRPGFPIGNPSVLASCILPAMLIAAAILGGVVVERVQERARLPWGRLLGAGAALVPLIWCFRLAGSRGATVGLAAGVFGVGFLVSKPRVRLGLVFLALLGSALGVWMYSTATQDLAMARGATVRFRVYAWRYAAALWGQRPISGFGAGAYPRLAGQLAANDRALDPAAFMADLVEHAHNELFEVLAEIGLVGGVTYVAGFVATLAAAGALLRANLSARRRWLYAGLAAGFCGLLGDALFGVALRLPGGPAVFFTLLGALWAACRSVSTRRTPAEGSRWVEWMLARRYGVAGAALLGASATLWLAGRDWRGALREGRATAAWEAGEYERAAEYAQRALPFLLDPVRRLTTLHLSLTASFEEAREYARRLDPASRHAGEDAAAIAALREQTRGLAAETFDMCLRCIARAPALSSLFETAARSAEIVAALQTDPAAAETWRRRAIQSWQALRQGRPYEPDALLALARYEVVRPARDSSAQVHPALLGDYAGLLRDALRAGFPSPDWLEAFRIAAATPGMEQVLDAMIRAVGPLNPQTNAENLMQSLAPERFRLRAMLRLARGEYAQAEQDAARAVELYVPLRARVPTLCSVALAEQADCALRATPREPERALALSQAALDALPAIQEQAGVEQARPFLARRATLLLAAGREDQAKSAWSEATGRPVTRRALADRYVELAQMFFRLPRERRPDVRRWTEAALSLAPEHFGAHAIAAWLAADEEGAPGALAVLARAADAGLTVEQLDRIRSSLCREFAALCEGLEPAPGQP